MRTRNRVIILVIVALASSFATLQAGQDESAKPRQTTQPKLSRTRSANCIVRITADPVIVPLDEATVKSLLHSSAVAAPAAREVFQREFPEGHWKQFIEMEWLNEFSLRRFSTSTSATDNVGVYDEQMMRELEKVYGRDYIREMGHIDSKSRDKPDQSAGGSADGTGRSGVRPPSQSGLAATPSVTIRLSIRLPDDVPPAAEEFLRAVISNFKHSLSHAYEVYLGDLDDQLTLTQGQYNHAVDTLQGGTSAATGIKERLNTVIDLSAWTPEMPIAEAVEMLRKSVDPPLNIVVLWTDLADSLQVEPTTPIRIDGMPRVKLGTALDLLVKGMPSVEAKPMWRIKGDAIVIATAAALGESAGSAGQAYVETDARALAAQRNGLTNQLQDLELSLAGQEARRKAISEQISRTQAQAQERLAKDEVTRELESLVRLSEENLSNLRKQADAGRASGTDLAQATESLARARIELAKRREELSKQVGGGQLEQLNSELSRMAIDGAEKEAQRAVLDRQLNRVQQQLTQAFTFDPEAARERLARETLDILASRIAELQTRLANLQPPMVMVIGAD